ncbi:arginine vasopressin-induced protein 1 [Sarcophilus harrisii]|uniref:Arginine vasopressin-induced protein 1 n=1 Tax=Sarcophilus harrisii TaxID=9305 RepID=A0A7N4PHR5_SARHA|nr:arginine vasopressin-induced protein 1 [Sarcophilus harrisii]
MGTPASVVSEPPPGQAPTGTRGRKQASANIFQDAELLQIRGLFQHSGDRQAEERAQIIWECAGDPKVAEALRQLRRKRRRPLGHSPQHCSRQRVPEDSPPADPSSATTELTTNGQHLNPRTNARNRRSWRKTSPTSYLHQIRH